MLKIQSFNVPAARTDVSYSQIGGSKHNYRPLRATPQLTTLLPYLTFLHNLLTLMDDSFLSDCDHLYNQFKKDVVEKDTSQRRELVQSLTLRLRRLVLDIEDLIPDLEESHISKRAKTNRNKEETAPQRLEKRHLMFIRKHPPLSDDIWRIIILYLPQDDVLRVAGLSKRIRHVCVEQRLCRVYLHKRYPPIVSTTFLVVPDTVLIEAWLTPIKTIVFDGLAELRVKVLAKIFDQASFIDLTPKVLTILINPNRSHLEHLKVGIHQLHHLKGKPPCRNIHVNCYYRPAAKVFNTLAPFELDVLHLSCIREDDALTPGSQVSTKTLILQGAMNPAIAKGVVMYKLKGLHFEYTSKCPTIAPFLTNLTSLSILVNTPPSYLDLLLVTVPLLLVPFLHNLDPSKIRWLKVHVVWQPILADLIPLVVQFPLVHVVDIECSTYALPFWPEFTAHKCLVERRSHLPNCFVQNDEGKFFAKKLFDRLHVLHRVTVGTDSFIREDGRVIFQLE